jgi:hypothetical protein
MLQHRPPRWPQPSAPPCRGRLPSAALTMPILGVQCFLARAALGWSVYRLACAAGVSSHTVVYFERGGSAKPSTVKTIQRTLEGAGIIFIDANDGGPGARLR